MEERVGVKEVREEVRMAEQQEGQYSDDRPARLWLQGEEFDGYLQALQWIRTTIEALHLPRGTWYRVVEAWPTQGVAKLVAKLTGQPVGGTPPGNRQMPLTEDRIRSMVWHVLVANSTPASLEQIYAALSQGAAELRRTQAPNGPFIWAVERTIEHSRDEAGNNIESNIIRVVVPVSRIWLDWPAEQ